MKLFNKTALAVAMSTMAVAPAIAADLTFNGDQTTVLANVIFGEGNPGVGSNETLIVAPNTRFNLDDPVGGAAAGDNILATETATIKYTLGGGAVFGEDLSTTALATPFVTANVAAGSVAVTVAQGGAIGDNTITFEITENGGPAAPATISSIDFGGFAIKNLQTPLAPSNVVGTVALGVEYVEPSVLADDGDDVATTATDVPLTILGSMDPFALTVTPRNFTATTRINVGNTEQTFTDANGVNTTFENGTTDFDPAGDVSVISLGTVQLSLRTAVSAGTVFAGVAGNVKKENGTDDFDFQGGDAHIINFSVADGSLQVGSALYLAPTAACATNFGEVEVINSAETNAFGLVVSGTTTQLTQQYHLCYSVLTGVNATTIPEVDKISATWQTVFFNQRYDNVLETDTDMFGALVRNGCVASFFNIPASTNNDTAYIRLTNTSSVNEGYIRGTLYAEDGSIIGGVEDVTIAPGDLKISATQIFSTEATTRPSATAGMDVISIEEAFGITPADINGRARLVLKGAFETCEGLGLLRTGDGSLFNMTATTQGNDTGVNGNNGQ